jgi:hypothetical protein
MLDAMQPALARTASPPARLAFVYVPNGVVMQRWTPAAAGALADLPTTLEPLAKHKDDVLVLSGLAHINGRALGDGPGDHARAAASYLTGVHPRKTAGADIKCGISADQVAASTLGKATRFASLELGCEDGRLVGNCDSGYSCAYSNSVSWRGEATPMPPEINPRVVFERLFGSGEHTVSRYRKSILDLVSEDAKTLQTSLGATDRKKLDEYLTGVREIERRIDTASEVKDPGIEAPEGIPAEFADHVRLMFDLLAVALQSDMTRVATFMMGREGSNRTYREIGVPDPHHGISHHRNEQALIEKLAKINRFHMELFAGFVSKLKSVPDGDATLLDRMTIVYGSGLSDGNRHWHHDLPVLIAGRGNGAWKTGRHVQYPKETPMTNLFLTLLDRAGVRAEAIGDSQGRLEHLTDL